MYRGLQNYARLMFPLGFMLLQGCHAYVRTEEPRRQPFHVGQCMDRVREEVAATGSLSDTTFASLHGVDNPDVVGFAIKPTADQTPDTFAKEICVMIVQAKAKAPPPAPQRMQTWCHPDFMGGTICE